MTVNIHIFRIGIENSRNILGAVSEQQPCSSEEEVSPAFAILLTILGKSKSIVHVTKNLFAVL